MAAKKQATQTRTRPSSATSSRSSASTSSQSLVASTVYKDFVVWSGDSAPAWHPIKKMRYVFWRMMSGIVTRDALRELHWQESEFWHLVDLKRHAPFREEYKRAKILQGRALADSVIEIAEGRDAVTKKHLRETKKLIDRALKKIARQKSALAGKAILESLLGDLRERDKIVMTRNKMQIDSVRWLAGKVNPAEFGEKSSLSLAGPGDGEGGTGAPRPIAIEFVGPDGRIVAL